MSNGNGKGTTTRQRRQYYYFYGSTTADIVVDDTNRGEARSPNEHDPLVGEALVPTDTEDETLPRKYDPDFQQLLMSKANGSELLPLTDEYPVRRRRRWGWRLKCCRSIDSHVAFIIGGAVLFLLFVTLLIAPESILFPDSVASNPTTIAQQQAKKFHMAFPEVDRLTYKDPVSKIIDVDLFHESLLVQGNKQLQKHTGMAGTNTSNNGVTESREFIFPFPTGAFWVNLCLKAVDDLGFSYPIAVYPYAYLWSATKLVASYPAMHRKQEATAMHDYVYPDLSFSESQGVTGRAIMSFDALSVTIRYLGHSPDSYWESYLIPGSPYITLRYSQSRPILRARSIFTSILCPRKDTGSGRRRQLRFGVCLSRAETSLKGVQFVIETQEGARWMMFSSEMATLQWDRINKTTITVAAENGQPFSGVLRFAIIPPGEEDGDDTTTSGWADQIKESTGMQRLIYHAGVYPVSGSVDWSVRSGVDATSSGGSDKATTSSTPSTTSSNSKSSTTTTSKGVRTATIKFNYETESFTPTGTATKPGSLLMLALPHHFESLPRSMLLKEDVFDFQFECIKGIMYPVLGSTWSYDEPLPALGFDGDSGANTNNLFLHPNVLPTIIDSLKVDVRLALPLLSDTIYGFGKKAARLAQLLHILDRILTGDKRYQPVSDSELPALKDNVLKILNDALSDYLLGNGADQLLFDRNLGGVLTSEGLSDSNADYGNGRYNDHHFHYGYMLYACAVLGRLSPKFVETRGGEVGMCHINTQQHLTCFFWHTDALLYDIAFNKNFGSEVAEGAFFPSARHKSWFDGHSFASGLFPFANGKSQESSSEAVNGYYGAYLWSLVRNGSDGPDTDESPQTNFMRILLATEIRGAKTYWHMHTQKSNSTRVGSAPVYNTKFRGNLMV